jgi:hypothetical protein
VPNEGYSGTHHAQQTPIHRTSDRTSVASGSIRCADLPEPHGVLLHLSRRREIHHSHPLPLALKCSGLPQHSLVTWRRAAREKLQIPVAHMPRNTSIIKVLLHSLRSIAAHVPPGGSQEQEPKR